MSNFRELRGKDLHFNIYILCRYIDVLYLEINLNKLLTENKRKVLTLIFFKLLTVYLNNKINYGREIIFKLFNSSNTVSSRVVSTYCHTGYKLTYNFRQTFFISKPMDINLPTCIPKNTFWLKLWIVFVY